MKTSATLLAAALWPIAAAAQTPAPGPANSGPMIVERVHSGWLAAPDFKVTDVDGKTSALAGGYAGWLSEGQLFVGGGGYWLANPASDRKLGYGGFVAQWLARTDERIGFGVKGLIGGGRATLGTTLTPVLRPADLNGFPFDRLDRTMVTRVMQTLRPVRVRYNEDFFVAEPEVDVVVRLTRNLRLTAGAGYRFIETEGRDDGRLRGATATVGLQIGGGY
jgi:hypothetical protein